MPEAPKPDQATLLARLPAMPPRPKSRPKMQAVGREEAARRRLTTRLESIPTDVEWPAFDARTVAVAAMMVANYVGQDAIRMRFLPLVSARIFDPSALDDLPVAARFVLRILPKLGPELHEREVAPPPEVVGAATAKRAELLRVVERPLDEIDEAHGRLVTVRLGTGNADVVHDLRMLADLVRDYADTLETEVSGFRRELEREARDVATRLELELVGPVGEEDREWRAYMLRALAMLVPLYEEVCRAGRFLFHKEKPEARFPTLASVARVRRRLQREMLRRSDRVPPPAPSQPREVMKSIPPEFVLVDVSDDEDQAMAGAMTAPSVPKMPVVPRAAPVPADARAAAPPPARARAAAEAPLVEADPFAPGAAPAAEPPPAADYLDFVALDFSPTTSAGEDADLDADTAEIDLDVNYASESNFYSDIAGTDVGLFIATFVVKPTGTPLSVRLTLPDLVEPILVSGAVEWVREFSPSIEAPPGMGIALRKLPPSHRAAIEAFTKVRSPILHDL